MKERTSSGRYRTYLHRGGRGEEGGGGEEQVAVRGAEERTSSGRYLTYLRRGGEEEEERRGAGRGYQRRGG